MTFQPTQNERLAAYLRTHPGASCAVCGLTFGSRRLRGTHERWRHPDWSAPPELRSERAQESRDAWAAGKTESQLFLIWSNSKAKRYGASPMDIDTPLPDGPCVYCGTTEGPMTWDHVRHLGGGGPHDVSNLVRSCRPCNERKNRHGVESSELITVLCGWCWTPLRRTLSRLVRSWSRPPAYFACSHQHLNMIRGYQPLPFGHPNFPRPRHVEIQAAMFPERTP